jgi:hypothetical protein
MMPPRATGIQDENDGVPMHFHIKGVGNDIIEK